MKAFALVLLALVPISSAQAANVIAGQARVASVCSNCHGMKTPSADAPFPVLAGRDAQYLTGALKQYRDKTRKSDIMNALAGSLTDADIDNVAAYYSRLK